MELIRGLGDLDHELGHAMATARAANRRPGLLREAAPHLHADELLHVGAGHVADGSEGTVPYLRAGGDDLERRMQDLHLGAHVVDLVEQECLDEEAIALERIDVDFFGAVIDCANVRHGRTIAAARRRGKGRDVSRRAAVARTERGVA